MNTPPTLKLDGAIALWRQGRASLAKAAEIAGLTVPELKEVLAVRWYSIGGVETTVLYVAHTVWENDDGEEIIRLISARKATPREAHRYYAQ